MVAAVVMISLMLGTNRMIALGMASSSNSSSRHTTEQEILGDIEDIQNIDTRLNNNPECISNQSSSMRLLDAVINSHPVPPCVADCTSPSIVRDTRDAVLQYTYADKLAVIPSVATAV